jgi:hypothetical protein
MTGNRVAAMMALLHLRAGPLERHRMVSESLGGLKESGQAVGAEVLTQLSGFAPPTVLAQAGRLQSRQRFFNLVITNVPGPQIPLYVLGRQLVDIFPLAPLAQRQALCIAIMSYNGRLNFGLLGDFDAMADLYLVAQGIRDSIDELRAAAGLGRRRGRRAARRRTAVGTRANGAAGNGSGESSWPPRPQVLRSPCPLGQSRPGESCTPYIPDPRPEPKIRSAIPPERDPETVIGIAPERRTTSKPPPPDVRGFDEPRAGPRRGARPRRDSSRHDRPGRPREALRSRLRSVRADDRGALRRWSNRRCR